MRAIHGLRLCGLAAVLAAGLALGCVPLPMLVTPPVEGRVVDETGRGLADAIVVVRFDARYDDLLPERDLVGHEEVVTDAEGRFRVPRGAKAGLSAWPLVRTEARIVGVMREGYRCGRPRGVGRSGAVEIRLEPAQGVEERRASCRPVAARPSETPAYLAAWQELYPRQRGRGHAVREPELDRTLAARALFGHGANCTGPVVDLALAPSGAWAALRVDPGEARGEGAEPRGRVEVVELAEGVRHAASLPLTEAHDGRRLAWTSDDVLLLWHPASPLSARLSTGAADAGAPRVLWRQGAVPAAPSRPGSDARPVPVRPADHNDARTARWQGRSFRVLHRPDPVTGLAADVLETRTAAGRRTTVRLPGETCGPAGRFGRPHLRIAADGRRGLDLRWLEGGCRAVAIDLETGRAVRLDATSSGGVCRDRRRVPLPQLRTALRSYAREIEETLDAAGGDPGAAYVLRIAPDGTTHIDARHYTGERLRLETIPFPIETPLRRIEVSTVARAGSGERAAPSPGLQPL